MQVDENRENIARLAYLEGLQQTRLFPFLLEEVAQKLPGPPGLRNGHGVSGPKSAVQARRRVHWWRPHFVATPRMLPEESRSVPWPTGRPGALRPREQSQLPEQEGQEEGRSGHKRAFHFQF